MSGNRCSTTKAARRINPAAKSRTPPTTAFGIRHVLRAGCDWLGRHRHLGKVYEVLLETTAAWIHAAMSGLALRRPAQI